MTRNLDSINQIAAYDYLDACKKQRIKDGTTDWLDDALMGIHA